MNSLRKTIFGYSTGDVNRYLRSFKRLSEADIAEWENKVADAARYRSSLRNMLAALEESQAPVKESAVAAALVEPERMESEALTSEGNAAGKFAIDEALAEETLYEETLNEEALYEETLNEETVNEELAPHAPAAVEEPLSVEDPAIEQRRERPAEDAAASEEPDEAVEEPIAAEEPAAATAKASNIVHFRRKQEVAEVYGGFWEGVDLYMQSPVIAGEPVHPEVEMYSVLPQQDGTNFAAEVPRYFNFSLNDALSPVAIPSVSARGRGTNERLAAVPQKKPEQEAVEKEKPPEAAIATPAPASAGSRAVTNEVRQLRYQYIVGKLAGEDLFSDRGELIIAKHRPITEAVVDEADRAGKLALLIIQMTIPGMEEES